MPTINVQISICGPYRNQGTIDRPVTEPVTRDQWIEIHAEQVYEMKVIY